MNYIVDHIPKDTPYNRRPCFFMEPTTITIHNTANLSSTAKNERGWLTNPLNKRTASYHIVVDEKEAVECIPLTENAWHAGDGSGVNSGNRTSIGVEICESGDYTKTLDNAANLVARMLVERGWGVDRLRRHWDWSGKICPRLMYDNGRWTGWIAFKNMVDFKMKSQPKEDDILKDQIEQLQQRIKALEAQQSMKVPDWAKDAVDAAVCAGIVDTPNGGSFDFYRVLTVLHRAGKI